MLVLSFFIFIFILFQISGPLLVQSQVRCIVDEIKQVITASSARKKERAERAKAEDFDAEEGELLKEENEQEEEVFDQVFFRLLEAAFFFFSLDLLIISGLTICCIIDISGINIIFSMQVGDCLGTLIKIFKASFLPFFDELSSYITPMWVSCHVTMLK